MKPTAPALLFLLSACPLPIETPTPGTTSTGSSTSESTDPNYPTTGPQPLPESTSGTTLHLDTTSFGSSTSSSSTGALEVSSSDESGSTTQGSSSGSGESSGSSGGSESGTESGTGTTTPTGPEGSEGSESSSSTGEILPDPFCGNSVVEGDEECDDGNEVDGDGCETLSCIVSPGGGCTSPGPGDLWFRFDWSQVTKAKEPKFAQHQWNAYFSWQPGQGFGGFPFVEIDGFADIGGDVPYWGSSVRLQAPSTLTVRFGLWYLESFSSASFCMEGGSYSQAETIAVDMLDGPCGAGMAQVPWVWPYQNYKGEWMYWRQKTEVDITDCLDPDTWESITFRPEQNIRLQTFTVIVRDPVLSQP